MKIKFSRKADEKHPVIVLPFFESKVDFDLVRKVSGITAKLDFTANEKESVLLFHPAKPRKVFLLGLGKESKMNQSDDVFRSFAFKNSKKWGGQVVFDLCHLPKGVAYYSSLGVCLSGYNMGDWKTGKPKENNTVVEFVHDAPKAKTLVVEGQKTAETQIEMMRLVNSPANIKSPRFIADYAKRSGKKHGFSVKVFSQKQMEKEGFHAVLAVGKGSVFEPALLQMEYKPKGLKSTTPKFGLVGKGVTFDNGGVSLKPSTNLHYMKSDMGGAAAVLGTIELAAKLKLNVHIVAVIPLAENSLGSGSYRPSDVIQSHSGKTIEIIDTDAEGRLLLADGLSFIQKRFHPTVVIDLATLTGRFESVV